MQTVVIVIHLLIVLALIGVVLLQKSEGGALGMGGGSGFLTSRGSSNVLTRTTAILAGIFFATSLMLSVLAGWGRQGSIFNSGAPASNSSPVGQPGQTPSAPGGSLLDQLQPKTQTAPTGPQVPQSK
jgi:preprotein translocase subunit SecG